MTKYEWVSIGIQFLTLVAIIVYTVFAKQQWGAMDKANSITREAAEAAKMSASIAKDALTKLQRPFIFIQGFPDHRRWDNLPDGRPSNVSYRVWAVLMNSGTTPTRDMTLVVEYSLQEKPLPAGFDFPFSVQPAPVMIGPQGLLNTAVGAITADDLLAVRNGSKHFYLWGKASYRDIFDDTPVHHLLFCYYLTNVLGDPTNLKTPRNPTGSDVRFNWFMHSEHNSTD
jgi:hypothetical protein